MKTLRLGSHWSFAFRSDPKRLAFVLARYKCASHFLPQEESVLELGCSEGIGASLLARKGCHYTGVDLDESAIQSAKERFDPKVFSFIHDDFMEKTYGAFGMVVSLDVVEHIHKEFEKLYFDTLARNVKKEGFCVVGTPNITAAPFASEMSNLGHVNLFSQERLVNRLKEYFHYVLPFGLNDEILHTGYAAMSHYLICIAFDKKEMP